MLICQDCRKWCQTNGLKDTGHGECRNHSPVYDKQTGSVWPITHEEEWCYDAVPDISMAN